MGNQIRIGTRGSELALWQARHLAELLGEGRTKIVVIKTKGDRIRNISFDKMEGKGFFTKEIEEALLDRRVDLAVHSMKDIPTEATPGLAIAAVLPREDPSDVLLIRSEKCEGGSFFPLREGSVVGTSSPRRAAQILNVMASLSLRPLRGNVTTRVRRLREGAFDALILARAGIKRLGLDTSGFIEYTLPFSFFLPAPAQGALAVQTRDDDRGLLAELARFDHEETRMAVTAERAFLERFGGGCHVPLGALAHVVHGSVRLSGAVASTNGVRLIRMRAEGKDPVEVGERLAGLFREKGADKLL